jgi:hypothetical protein
VGFPPRAGIGGRAEMSKFTAVGGTTRHTTAMCPDPAPMAGPDRLQGKADAHFGGLQFSGEGDGHWLIFSNAQRDWVEAQV